MCTSDTDHRVSHISTNERASPRMRICVRIPPNPITHSGVFDHPRSEAAERPKRGLGHPLMVTARGTSEQFIADAVQARLANQLADLYLQEFRFKPAPSEVT